MDHSPRFLKLCDAARTSVTEISIDEVRERMQRGDRFELVDVREDREVARGKLEGARHLGRGVIERDIEKAIPDPAADIVLYCGGGYRSVLVAESLAKMGYTHVRSMAGGFRAWTGRGFPTTL
jgi:rhodanese-related sulfurtransferase